ncbi:MAG: lasso peptide biosynthesis protein [Pseudonocardiaceae bacterium]
MGMRTEGRRALRTELRALMLGDVAVPRSMPVRDWELIPATLIAVRIGRAFRGGGLPAALPLLPQIDGHPQTDRRSQTYRVRALRAQVSEAAVFCARDAAWRLLGLVRTVAGRQLCLHESLSACAGLRRLGFPAEVVIGYPVIEVADGGEELHAWPVLGDSPLTGRPGERPLGYVELTRYPEESPW